jgi:crotonobetainyl-CoA:carnitine CoA-transferase CaiB-like acyl-CoA transferase
MTDGAPPTGLLDHITVLDLTTFVTGGFATLMLANQGAEVIKVERPEVGDDNRHSGPPFVETGGYEGPGVTAAERGESPYFWTVNYGKRSIELNLKSEAARAVLYDLAAQADVFVENFRPGTADRLGVGYDDIQEHNDAIVYCSISAFGETGPWSQRPGYDLLVQGTSGIMSVTGPEDGEPAKVGLPATDLITAMWAAFGITGALFRRARTGEGERVELGMHDAALPWLTKQAGKAFVGEEPTRMGTKDPVLAPYQAYPTADGYLNVACANQKLWSQLCEAIGRPELDDDARFATNADRVEHMDALEAELATTFEQRPTDEWVARLGEDAGLPVGPVLSVPEALEHEQTQARGVISELEHPAAGDIPVIEHPLRFAGADSGFDEAPPLLGEDTEAVLQEAGYDEAAIADLKRAGAVPDRD